MMPKVDNDEGITTLTFRQEQVKIKLFAAHNKTWQTKTKNL